MAKDYKIVLVLGNGFDLDLGLKTKYSDFLESPFFVNNTTNNTSDHLANMLYLKSEKDINIFNYLKCVKNQNNWIDIETELAKLASRYNSQDGVIKHKYKVSNEERSTFNKLHEELCNYLQSIDYANIKSDSIAVKLLKIIVKYRFAEILSYNYTDIRKLESIVGRINIPVDNIHGRISDQSIIIGIQDEVDIHNSYCFMIKSFSPFFKSHNVREKLLNADEIIFFGHSLGSTDYHYFEDLFKNQSQADKANKKLILRIFTYDEVSRISILTQLRAMNEKRTDMLYDLCNFEIYRTGEIGDKNKIRSYLSELDKRICVYNNPPKRKVNVRSISF